MSCDLYTDPTALSHLLTEVCAYLAQIPNVTHILTFGSLAHNTTDRWSDIDLIVVTTGTNQQLPLFNHLAQHKSILHHGPFGNSQPSGSYILGIVFANESIFHCLDLNCLSLADYNTPGTLDRFGQTALLHSNLSTQVAPQPDLNGLPPAEHPDEKRINEALHFTKKALKKFLRQTGSSDDLRQRASWLQQIMQDYPHDIDFPTGKIGQLAHCYLDLVGQTLRE